MPRCGLLAREARKPVLPPRFVGREILLAVQRNEAFSSTKITQRVAKKGSLFCDPLCDLCVFVVGSSHRSFLRKAHRIDCQALNGEPVGYFDFPYYEAVGSNSL